MMIHDPRFMMKSGSDIPLPENRKRASPCRRASKKKAIPSWSPRYVRLAGVICSHETRCQIMVQNVPELGPKSVNRTRIEGGEICSKPM